jgi:hypothetical protein
VFACISGSRVLLWLLGLPDAQAPTERRQSILDLDRDTISMCRHFQASEIMNSSVDNPQLREKVQRQRISNSPKLKCTEIQVEAYDREKTGMKIGIVGKRKGQ